MGNLFVLLWIVSASVAFSAQKEYSQYWKDLGFDYTVVEATVLEEASCYQNEKNFLSCLISLSQIVRSVAENATLKSTDEVLKMVPVVTPIAQFGAVSVVPAKKEKLGRAARILQMRKEKEASQLEWNRLFTLKDSNRVDITSLHKWIRQQPYFARGEYGFYSLAKQNELSIKYDPHTSILPREYVDDESSGNEDFVGIGAVMMTDPSRGLPMIQSPLENSPAIKAGLRPNDIILSVDGMSVQGKELQEVIEKIRGPQNSKIQLTIERGDKTLEITVERDKIVLPNVSTRLVKTPHSLPLGIIKFRSFMSFTGCEDMEEAIHSLEAQGAKALVLDLRGNGGGLLDQATCVVNLFVGAGLVVSTQRAVDGSGKILFSHETTKSAVTRLPLFVLIDARSASASEIVSGALQDHQRAWVIGERSFGKGTVQTQVPFPSRDGKFYMRRTVARFYLPSGRTNQVEGITPDFEAYPIPNPTEDDKAQLREEDEYQALPPKGNAWIQQRPQEVSSLDQCRRTFGKAPATFLEESKTSVLAPDYPVLVTEDLLDCMQVK